ETRGGSAGRIGLRDQVKNPLLCQAQAICVKGEISVQNRIAHTHQTDQSIKTNGNVLHHHPSASHPKRQWSIFFN
ncbi:hypothetical protein, partial [Pseudomonas savastanoi]